MGSFSAMAIASVVMDADTSLFQGHSSSALRLLPIVGTGIRPWVGLAFAEVVVVAVEEEEALTLKDGDKDVL